MSPSLSDPLKPEHSKQATFRKRKRLPQSAKGVWEKTKAEVWKDYITGYF